VGCDSRGAELEDWIASVASIQGEHSRNWLDPHGAGARKSTAMSKISAALVAVVVMGLVLWLTPSWGIWSATWVPVAFVAGYVVFLVLADKGDAASDTFATRPRRNAASPVPHEPDAHCASDAA
jgi:hypothetical protein